MGALSGSREPSPDGLGPSGFDPARIMTALKEAVYAVRNAAGISEWHKRFSTRPFDHEDFRVWAEHWELMHPVVTAIAALDDRDALLRSDRDQCDPDSLTGCADDQDWRHFSADELRAGVAIAMAREARRRESGSGPSGLPSAGPKDIAQ